MKKKPTDYMPIDHMSPFFYFFMAYFVAFLFYKFHEDPNVFSSSFWENTKIVIDHIGQALLFLLGICFAFPFFAIPYIAATCKFETRIGRIISTILFIIAMLLVYILCLSD